MHIIVKRKAFTLVELIVVMAILGFVIIMSFNLILFGFNVFNKGSNQLEIQNTVRLTAMKINKLVGTANDIQVFDTMPHSLGLYNYIYVDGYAIKHRNTDGSEITTLAVLDSTGTPPSLNFDVDGGNKILIFTVSTQINNQDFSVESKLTPSNLPVASTIIIDPSLTSGGSVIAYSNPVLAPDAIVRIDSLEFDFYYYNPFLVDNSPINYTLSPPHIMQNFVNLIDKGNLGSVITWSSNSSPYIVTSGSDIGKIYRPSSTDTDATVTLTATFTKGSATMTKSFDLVIEKLAPLAFTSPTTLVYDAINGVDFEFTATGGNPRYKFVASSLPAGLSLSEDGILLGNLDISILPIIFSVTVTDSHTLTTGDAAYNSTTITFTIQ